MYVNTRHACALTLVALSACIPCGLLAADFFMGLGTLGGAESSATGISANGGVVVGWSDTSGYTDSRAFHWSYGVLAGLGTLGGTNSSAWAVSPDGGVVAGESDIAGDAATHAFRWNGGTMTDLGTLGGSNSYAYGVSNLGNVVVGDSDVAGDAVFHAFRWAGGAMSDLGTLGGSNSSATAVSYYGDVVVGSSHITGDGAEHAFRWEKGTMTDLGTLGGNNSRADGVSGFGGVVVGQSHLAGDVAYHAFRWENGTMSDLGTLGGTLSTAKAISGDGTAIVGSSSTTGDVATHAFRWKADTGMQDVADWLAGAGIAIPAGWTLTSATAVNSNGNVLVGYGANPGGDNEAWLARVGPEGSGLLLDVTTYNSSLIDTGANSLRAGIGLASLAMFGSHHRSLLDSGLTRGNGCAWATADGANHPDIRMELIEVGACKDVGRARVGLGIGQNVARQDAALGGGANFNGQHVIGEVDYLLGDSLEAGLTAYYGSFSGEIRRNYPSGAGTDTSTGKPDAESSGWRLRLAWNNAAHLGRFQFGPHFAYTSFTTRLDAYTESGGGFPARYDARSWTVDDMRIGLAASTRTGDKGSLRIGLEAVHRSEDDTRGVSGQAIGLWDFSLPGTRLRRDWLHASIDYDHSIREGLLFTLGVQAASSGEDADWGATLGLRASF